MASPRIATVGSADPSRTAEIELKHADLLSQFATSPELVGTTAADSAARARNLALVGAGIGLVAGLTFESVYRKPSSVDVVHAETLERP